MSTKGSSEGPRDLEPNKPSNGTNPSAVGSASTEADLARANVKIAKLYLPTGWCEATCAGWGGSKCNEGLRSVMKADSLMA